MPYQVLTVSLANVSGATFDLNGHIDTIGGLSGGGTTGGNVINSGASLTIGTSGNPSYLGAISGAGSIIVSGTGSNT